MQKIAVIEDNADIREMYVSKLREGGFDVRSADNGHEGLRIVEEFKPDLVLLDLSMPAMTGQEMLKKLRSQPWGKNVSVIVLTNLNQSEASLDLEGLNVEKYAVKAYFTPKQIVEMASETLKKFERPQS